MESLYPQIIIPSEEQEEKPKLSPTTVPGLTLSWHNLSVWVRKKDEDKSTVLKTRYYDCKILRKVSGVAEPGQLMAIMGPSGAGKTTLLATISQRLIGDFKGKILVNGKQISKELMLRVSGFVPQHDLVFESLTVYEHLQLMAKFKLDRDLKPEQRNLKVLAVITDLGLASIKHSRISMISGGEKKRLSMAVQLLTDPAILFCDEPTTGLDSFSAFSLIEHLRRLSAAGKAVVCTVHQPASGIFEMFDSIYFLVAGGRTAVDCSTSEAPAYFSNIGIVCPPTYNFAEFLVNQLAIADDAESQIRVNKVCRYYRESIYYENLLKRLESEMMQGKQYTLENLESSSDNLEDSLYQPSNDFSKYLAVKGPTQLTQLSLLLWRSCIDWIRNPQQHFIRFIVYMILAFIISIPYVEISLDQEGIQNIQGFLYLVIVETIFTFSYSVAHTFPSEIPIMLREVDNGLYTPGPYYISKLIMLFPRAVLEPIVYSAITFFIPGLAGGIQGYLLFCIPVIMCSIVATAYGCLISAVFDSIASGSMFSVPFEQIGLLFCGLYLSLSDVPFHFAWVKYVSVFYYGLEAMSILQWTQVKDIPCPHPERPCIDTGSGVLQHYGYNEGHFLIDIIGLICIYCGCHCIGFLAIWKKSKAQASY